MRDLRLDSLSLGTLQARWSLEDSLHLRVALRQPVLAIRSRSTAGDSTGQRPGAGAGVAPQGADSHPAGGNAAATFPVRSSMGYASTGSAPPADSSAVPGAWLWLEAPAGPLLAVLAPWGFSDSTGSRANGEEAERDHPSRVVVRARARRMDLGAVLTHVFGVRSAGWVELTGEVSAPLASRGGGDAPEADTTGSAWDWSRLRGRLLWRGAGRGRSPRRGGSGGSCSRAP